MHFSSTRWWELLNGQWHKLFPRPVETLIRGLYSLSIYFIQDFSTSSKRAHSCAAQHTQTIFHPGLEQCLWIHNFGKRMIIYLTHFTTDKGEKPAPLEQIKHSSCGVFQLDASFSSFQLFHLQHERCSKITTDQDVCTGYVMVGTLLKATGLPLCLQQFSEVVKSNWNNAQSFLKSFGSSPLHTFATE